MAFQHGRMTGGGGRCELLQLRPLRGQNVVDGRGSRERRRSMIVGVVADWRH